MPVSYAHLRAANRMKFPKEASAGSEHLDPDSIGQRSPTDRLEFARRE